MPLILIAISCFLLPTHSTADSLSVIRGERINGNLPKRQKENHRHSHELSRWRKKENSGGEKKKNGKLSLEMVEQREFSVQLFHEDDMKDDHSEKERSAQHSMEEALTLRGTDNPLLRQSLTSVSTVLPSPVASRSKAAPNLHLREDATLRPTTDPEKSSSLKVPFLDKSSISTDWNKPRNWPSPQSQTVNNTGMFDILSAKKRVHDSVRSRTSMDTDTNFFFTSNDNIINSEDAPTLNDTERKIHPVGQTSATINDGQTIGPQSLNGTFGPLLNVTGLSHITSAPSPLSKRDFFDNSSKKRLPVALEAVGKMQLSSEMPNTTFGAQPRRKSSSESKRSVSKSASATEPPTFPSNNGSESAGLSFRGKDRLSVQPSPEIYSKSNTHVTSSYLRNITSAMDSIEDIPADPKEKKLRNPLLQKISVNLTSQSSSAATSSESSTSLEKVKIIRPTGSPSAPGSSGPTPMLRASTPPSTASLDGLNQEASSMFPSGSGGGIWINNLMKPTVPTVHRVPTAITDREADIVAVPSCSPSKENDAPRASSFPTTSPSVSKKPKTMANTANSIEFANGTYEHVPNASEYKKCPDHTEDQRIESIRAQLRWLTFPASVERAKAQNNLSPQEEALRWIIEKDPRHLCPGDETLVQRYVLAVVYYAMGGEGWSRCSAIDASPLIRRNSNHVAANGRSASIDFCATSWDGRDLAAFMSGGSECDWFGVTCEWSEVEGGRVTEIHLDDNGLSGSIPDEITTLSSLKVLDMDGNRNIVGRIPNAIGRLSNLKTLDFDDNSLTGSIPHGLYRLSNLRTLDLDSNLLDGTISESVAEMSSLEVVQLHNNNFFGTVPAAFGELNSLGALFLHNNTFSGKLDDTICSLKLQYLWVDCIQCPPTDKDCCKICI